MNKYRRGNNESGRIPTGTVIRASAAAAIVIIIVILGIIGIKKGSDRKRSANVCSMIISESRKIAELTTDEYIEDMILFDTEYSNYRLDTVAVVIARGKVRAGFDISGMRSEDIRIAGDSIFVRVPEPRILDVIINPSDVNIFYSAKDWNSANRLNLLLVKGKAKVTRSAIQSGILDKANDNGVRLLESMLRSSGYDHIEIITSPAPQNDLELPESTKK